MFWRTPLLLALAGCASIASSAPGAQHTRSPARTASSGTLHLPARTMQQVAAVLARPVPARNLYLLTQQLRLHPPHAVSPVARTRPFNYAVGHVDRFWVLGEDTNSYFRMAATIRAETPHFYLYVQNGLHMSDAVVRREADAFERKIYPTDRAHFGSEWRPGVDGDVHITCLIGNLRSSGVGGYFSAEDEYPRAVNPYSNQREMFYINSGEGSVPGDASFDLTLAHEFQHMIHWHMHPHENLWLNEGMSMLAERLNGFTPTAEPESFLSSPSTQLTSWNESASASWAHYGAAYLYLSYLYDRYGSGLIRDILDDRGLTDFPLIDDVLRRRHIHATADDLFRQWVVANYLGDSTVPGGVYGYRGLPHTVSVQKSVGIPSTTRVTVPPYAAHYTAITGLQGQHAVHLRFAAPGTMPLLSPTITGSYWWSNRGDMMMTSLERPIDLRRVHHATLHFAAWYDIEKDYDYAYVETSVDGGRTWTPLHGTHSTTANPNGASYGQAYTGDSRTWQQESVELSRYAGRRILLRFQYVTDEGYNGQSFAVRDIAIPELGWHDTFTGWHTAGFVPLAVNRVPVRWHVQLVTYTTQGVRVSSMPVTGGQGSLTLDPAKQGIRKVVVVVYGLAPKTTLTVPYTLSVQ